MKWYHPKKGTNIFLLDYNPYAPYAFHLSEFAEFQLLNKVL